ncbi:unnamed protein product [Rhodiola kirilowii]
MESILVIKVKCGDTLRRFNTSIVENGKLELNMEQLREKMRSLFNLAEDDDFTLTYTDTDGDSVTLVEDCDLDDVVLQRLNPVRMVLMLKTGDKGGSSNVRSSRNSTPRDSSRVLHQQSVENIQNSVEKVVKNFPEPLHGLLLKLTRDLAATASAPVISDIIRSAAKIGESFTCENSQSFARKESVVENKASEGETSSGLPGSKSKIDAEGKFKAREMDSGVCRVPDLNHAPPPLSGFAVTGADTSAGNNITGKTVPRCPMFANEGSPNVDAKPYNGCPFLKTRPDVRFPTFYKGDRGPQFKRSHSHSDRVGPAVHTGVQCDICDVNPITGPRFKSKVRHNYDLCNLCYKKSGKEADYVRIDSPTLYHEIMKALHRKHGGYGHRFQSYGPFKPVAEPYVPYTVKPVSLVNQVKLDSRFILDVNVIDGTVMAPSTCFTKIWRMQNSGNAVWPVGTQLVWTDGDKFSYPALSVDLEIPATGVPVEGEIDVAVDFVAPELPGEYVSYWRMSSPSGLRFGQRVWVAIQVEASPDPLSDSFRQLNLNLPYGSKNIPVVIDINVEPPVNSPSYSRPAVDPVETVTVSSKDGYEQSTTAVIPPAIESFPEAVSRKGSMEEGQDQNHESEVVAASETMGSASNDQDLNFPINDFLLVGDAFSKAPVVPSVTYPAVDSSKIEDGALPVQASSKVESLVPLPKYAVFSEMEESLLKNLSEMGFSQVDLNREILRKNGYDMEKTLVDLWDISEWDPIMEELEEMGFSDKKKNAILLVKNKGSIKRVVMDLVAGGDKSQ